MDRALPAGVGDALRTVAAELGLRASGAEGSVAAELRPEWARSRLYEAFLELLRRLGDQAPVVLVVEDLHWADDSTRELLAFLVRNVRDQRLLLAMTFRSDELHRRHPLVPWLAEVDRAPGVERIELHRLDRTQVVRQLRAILGAPPDDALVTAVFERSEGNPFYAEELLAAGLGSRRLPPTLREVLAARLALVSDATMRVLGVAAIAGRSVEHDLLAAVAGIDEPALLEALREATAAQLLVADDDAQAERYTFRHALVGEAAAETVLPGERRRLHVAIAEALEAGPAAARAGGAVRLAEIAHHWHEARDSGRAFAASLAAGGAAFDAHAYAESQRQLERALSLWDLVPDAPEAAGVDRIELLRQTARSAQLAGDYARARAHLREAIESLDPATEPGRVGVLHERLGRAFWTDGQMIDGLVHYARAVELVPAEPPSVDRARVLAGYAQVMMLVGRYRDSEKTGEAARAMAKALGNRQIEGHAATTVGGARAFGGDIEGGLAISYEGLAVSIDAADQDDVGRAHANLATILDLAGRLDESIEISLAGAAAMGRVGLATTYGVFNQLNAADGLFQRGRWSEMADLLDEILPIATGTAALYGLQVHARLLVGRGEIELARRTLERTRELMGPTTDSQFNGPLTEAELELASWSGDVEAGRAAAERGLAILGDTEDFKMYAFVAAAALRVEADAAERARATRDSASAELAEQRAATLRARLDARLADAPSDGLLAEEIGRHVALADAEAARAAGRNAPDAWRAATDAVRDRRLPYPTAYAAYRTAEAILAAKGDRDEAGTLLAEAFKATRALGAAPLEAAVAGLAARARLPLETEAPVEGAASTEPGPTASPGADGSAYDLTPRELEVLRLVAAGRTNRQIADELFISESTAGVHVSHILGKLGVGGRAEAAAIAVRMGVAG